MAPSDADKAFIEQICGLWDENETADFVVTYGRNGHKEKHVHRSVISARSDYFHNACKNVFAEGQNQGIDLREDDEFAVESVLRFMYFDDYCGGDTGVESESIESHIEVYLLADKFCLDGLKERSVSYVRGILSSKEDEQLLELGQSIYDRTWQTNDILRKEVATALFNKVDVSNDKKRQIRVALELNPELAADVAVIGMTERRAESGHTGSSGTPGCSQPGQSPMYTCPYDISLHWQQHMLQQYPQLYSVPLHNGRIALQNAQQQMAVAQTVRNPATNVPRANQP